MGLFDFIGNVANTLITNPIGSLEQGAEATGALFAAPGTTLTQGVQAGEAAVSQQTPTQQAVNIALSTGLAAVGTLGIGGAVASAVGSEVIPNILKPVFTTGGQVTTGSVIRGTITSAAGTAAVGAIQASPNVPQQAVTYGLQVPGQLLSYGYDVALFAAQPSYPGADNLIKNHGPAIVATLLATGYLSSTAISILTTAYDSYVTRQNTKATLANTAASSDTSNSNSLPSSTPTQPPVTIVNNIPPAPAPSPAPPASVPQSIKITNPSIVHVSKRTKAHRGRHSTRSRKHTRRASR